MAAATPTPGTPGTDTTDGLKVPARRIPIPDTVSPAMQAVIAQVQDPAFNIAPTSAAGWKARPAAVT